MQNIDLFRLDGHSLRVFVAVCETGSVSQTALQFDLSQSTISHTLEKLRATLNDPLFVKAGRGIVPTEKSLSLLPKVQRMLADWEGLTDADSYDPAEDAQPFRLAVPFEPLRSHIKNLYRTLRHAAPNAQLVLAPQVSRSLIAEELALYRLDLAITVSGEKYQSTLNFTPFWRDKMVICHDPEIRDPIKSLKDYEAAKHGVVSFGGNSKSEVEKRVGTIGIQRDVVLTAATISNLAALMKGTSIITTMPSAVAKSYFHEFVALPPPFPLDDLIFDLVWHRRYDTSLRNTWLRELTMKSRVGNTAQ